MFEDIIKNHVGLFVSNIMSNLFEPFPNEINFTKLKYNEKNGLLKEYMT